MPIDIKATGATFNALKGVAAGEYDVPKCVELAVGKKFGVISAAFKSTVSDEKITQAIVDWAKGKPIDSKEAKLRIQNILALEGATEIKPDAKLVNPVNILASLACLGKTEERAALKVNKLFFLVKQAEFRSADKLVAGLFGGDVRQAVSGGFTEFGKEKYTGFAGMAKAAQLAIDAINKRI